MCRRTRPSAVAGLVHERPGRRSDEIVERVLEGVGWSGLETSGSRSCHDRAHRPSASGRARVEDDLGELGAEHRAGVAQQRDQRRSRSPASAAGSARTRRAARAARASRVRRCTPGRRRRSSRAGARAATAGLGSSHRIVTASSARLVFASATMLPNWIISGSFWNCGAPPDRVMTSAIVIELTTVASVVAVNAAAHSRTPGGPVGDAIDRRIVIDDDRDQPVVREVERELDRAGAGQQMAAADPTRTASRYSRGRQEEHADDGRELAQRERVRLAPEMDLDDLELGDEERRRRSPATGWRSAPRGPGDRPAGPRSRRWPAPPGRRSAPRRGRAWGSRSADATRPCRSGTCRASGASADVRCAVALDRLRMSLLILDKRHGPRSRGSSPMLYPTRPSTHHAGGMGGGWDHRPDAGPLRP